MEQSELIKFGTPYIKPAAAVAALLNERAQAHPYFSDCKIHVTWKDELLYTLYNMSEGDEKESLITSAINELVAMNEAVARGECTELGIDNSDAF